MNRFLIPLIAFALLAVVLAVGVKRSPQKSILPSALVGRPAPPFSLPELLASGQNSGPERYKGRWFAMNVWATWCVECRREHATLLQAQRDGRIPLLGLDWKDDDNAAREWLTSLGDPYDVVVVDRDGKVAIDYGVYGAPETFLVNDKGEVVYRHVGPLDWASWETEFLARLPGKESP
ncbi:MAG: DsbE family thiol:disulfide interchange protein [Steroidobacteraceae bacterium]